MGKKEIKIIDSNICRVSASDKVEILVNKGDAIFETDYIEGFSEVKISPDKSKICFIGWPPAPSPILYCKNLNSGEIAKIYSSKNCFWSPDSLKIAFNNHTTDVSPIDIFVYDTLSGETKNLTKNATQKVSFYFNHPCSDVSIRYKLA